MADDKKFYWIKLKTDFFDLPTIDWLLEQENGCEYVVLYQKLCLLTANNGGELSRRIGEMIIPFEPKKIAEITRFDVDTVVVALELYKRLRLIYEHENGFLHISDFESLVGAETKWAEKKRLQRGQKKDIVPGLQEGQDEDNVPDLSPESEDIVRQEIEIRDRDRDKSLEIDTELEKEKKKKGKEKAPAEAVAAPDFSETTFSDTMVEKVEAWLRYKKERREGYKPTGLAALISEIQNNVNRYGEQPVMDLIGSCMASGYRGITFDRLKSLPEVRRPDQPATVDTNNEFARLMQQNWGDDT